MTSPENSLPSAAANESEALQADLASDLPDSSESSSAMDDFYQLRQELLLATLVISGVVFGSVWWFYDLNVALSYLFGAVGGMLYFRRLAKGVEELGPGQQLGKSHLALFVVLIVIAARWDQLQLLPVFLGFLTYKLAILYYTFRITLLR